jgi:hypothetical protein
MLGMWDDADKAYIYYLHRRISWRVAAFKTETHNNSI